jgi:hypothetical protein
MTEVEQMRAELEELKRQLAQLYVANHHIMNKLMYNIPANYDHNDYRARKYQEWVDQRADT